LDEAQARAVNLLAAALPSCKSLASLSAVGKGESEGDVEGDVDGASAWVAFLASPTPETCVPTTLSHKGLSSWMRAQDAKDPIRVVFLGLLVVKTLRPDRLVAAMERFVDAAFTTSTSSSSSSSSQFPWRGTAGGSPIADLQHLVEDELSTATPKDGGGGSGSGGAAGAGSVTPVLLCAVGAGHDASGRVESLAALRKVPLFAVSMGSSEGLLDAEKLVRKHAKAGQAWVLLRNVHLVPSWLEELEKKLHGLHASPSFRLFLTADATPKLPLSLLGASRVVVSDAPTGVKASLSRILRSVPLQRLSGGAHERRRLYLLLAWFHAVVAERLRYAPLAGFSKAHEWAPCDAECGLAVVDQWVGAAAGSRSHVDPHTEVPWVAIRAVLGESTYGGRVDSWFDHRVVRSFLKALFVPESFDPGFRPATPDAPELPEPGSAEALLAWVDQLPESNPPTWVGLAPAAEARLSALTGSRVLRKVALLQDGGLDDDDGGDEGDEDKDAEGGGGSGGGGAASSGKMVLLGERVKEWASSLAPHEKSLADAADAAAEAAAVSATTPAGKFSSSSSSSSSSAALTRCLSREVAKGSSLLSLVLSDLREVASFCAGEARVTNPLRALVADLGRGATPAAWRKAFVCSAACASACDAWLADFGLRVNHCLDLAKPYLRGSAAGVGAPAVGSSGPAAAVPVYWLGGLFNPEAFVTASRQHTAQATGLALDQLVPAVSLTTAFDDSTAEKGAESGGDTPGEAVFLLRGLMLEGSGWDDQRQELVVGEQVKTPVAQARFRWVRRSQDGNDDGGSAGAPTAGSKDEGAAAAPPLSSIAIPLYLNDGRAVLLATVDLRYQAEAQPAHVFYQRSAALVAWSG